MVSCFMHGHKFARGKNDSQRVGIDRFTSKLHSRFVDGGTKNKCYKHVCSHIQIILDLNQVVLKTFSSSKILLEISEHIHVIGSKNLLQTLIAMKS